MMARILNFCGGHDGLWRVARMTTLAGEPLAPVAPAPEWLFLKAACYIGRDYGFDLFTISQARLCNREFQANKFGLGGPTDVMQRVAGKAPDDFETIVRGFIGESRLRDAQRPRLAHGHAEIYGRALATDTQPQGAGAAESVIGCWPAFVCSRMRSR